MKESLLLFSVKSFAGLIRALPLPVALWMGRRIGDCARIFNNKAKIQVYTNLKTAFAGDKNPRELIKITRQVFQNYGQNIIEMLRLPLMTQDKFKSLVELEGKEHFDQCLAQGKGLILLAMHFGSWEMASLTCPLMGYPYKIFVKKQPRLTKLHELLNSYRSCGGAVVISRGAGTRDFIRSLKDNEIIGMVADQGGRDGIRVPFFGRQASLSSGAIRMGLKLNVPICFSVIIRQRNGKHRIVVHDPLEMARTGDLEEDVRVNLTKVAELMEKNIRDYPAEYMWFYKIWKYSDEAKITVLSDGKIGHQHQSEAVASGIQAALEERGISSEVNLIRIHFKNAFAQKCLAVINKCLPSFFLYGRLSRLRFFLESQSLARVHSQKSDFIISCGSTVAALNKILSSELNAKSAVVLKPGLQSFQDYDLVVLPHHDRPKNRPKGFDLAVTNGAPNVINQKFLNEQTEKLLNRYSHLKTKLRPKIGVLIGGESKNIHVPESQIRNLIRHLREVSQELNYDLLITTSRRTPPEVEDLLVRKLKRYEHCQLLILANQTNIPEAMGGILGLSDLIIVSGDSISMVSEAAASGKKTIVFTPKLKKTKVLKNPKHLKFIHHLNEKGFIVSSDVTNIGQAMYDVIKNKIHTRTMDDQKIILEAARRII